MRHASTVALLAGPMVLSAYLVGAATAWLTGRDDDGRPSDWVLDAFVVLAVSTAAWFTIEAVSPGSNLSRVGYYSSQVLSAWHSVALWSGIAVIAGMCAPVFRRFHGGTGMAPAAALLAVHFPWFLFACIGGAFGGFAVSRSTRTARLCAIAALLPTAWLGWVLEWLPAWGLTAGPEATLWAMVLSAVLGVRWWSERSRSEAE